jgi:hypothetical protein
MRYTGWVAKRFVGDRALAERFIPEARGYLGELVQRMRLGRLGFGSRTIETSYGVTYTVRVAGGIPIIQIDVTALQAAEECAPQALEGFVCVPMENSTSLGLFQADWPDYHPDDPLRRVEVLLRIKGSGTTTQGPSYKPYFWSAATLNLSPPEGFTLGEYKTVDPGCGRRKLEYPYLQGGNKDWVGKQREHLGCTWYGVASTRYFGNKGWGGDSLIVTIDGDNYNIASGYNTAAVWFRGIAVLDDTSYPPSDGGTPASGSGFLVMGAAVRRISSSESYLFVLACDWYGSSQVHMFRWELGPPTAAEIAGGKRKYVARNRIDLGTYDSEAGNPIHHAAFNASCTEAHFCVIDGQAARGNQPYGVRAHLSTVDAVVFEEVDLDVAPTDTEYVDYLPIAQQECMPVTIFHSIQGGEDCRDGCVCAFGIPLGNVISHGNGHDYYAAQETYLVGYDYKEDVLIKAHLRIEASADIVTTITDGIPTFTQSGDQSSLCDLPATCQATIDGGDNFPMVEVNYHLNVANNLGTQIDTTKLERHYLSFSGACTDEILLYQRTETGSETITTTFTLDNNALPSVVGTAFAPTCTLRPGDDFETAYDYDSTQERSSTVTTTRRPTIHIDPRNRVYAYIEEVHTRTDGLSVETSGSGDDFDTDGFQTTSTGSSSISQSADRKYVLLVGDISYESAVDTVTDSDTTPISGSSHTYPENWLTTIRFSDGSEPTTYCDPGDAYDESHQTPDLDLYDFFVPSPVSNPTETAVGDFWSNNGIGLPKPGAGPITWMLRVHPQVQIVNYAGATSMFYNKAHFVSIPWGFSETEQAYKNVLSNGQEPGVLVGWDDPALGAGDTDLSFYPIWPLYDLYRPTGI